MGHVDHPHQAIGDSQAQCGQQQDATKADAGEHLADTLIHGQVSIDMLQRILDGGFHFRICFATLGQPSRKHLLDA